MEKLLKITVFALIFLSSITLYNQQPEIYLGYVGIFILLPKLVSKNGFPKHLIFIYLVLIVSGILSVFSGDNSYFQFFKILIGTFFSYLFFYYVFIEFKDKLGVLLNLYIKASYIVGIIGIVQFISYQIGFEAGYNFSWILNKWKVTPGGLGVRVNSLFIEPTYYATFLSPALFFALARLFNIQNQFFTKNSSVIFSFAYILSFSGAGFLALFILILIFFLNFGLVRYSIVFALICGALFYTFNNYIPEFRSRYQGSIEIFSRGKFELGKTHGSSIILYNNSIVATKNFIQNPFFGTGLGSHPTAFDKYSITKEFDQTGISLNKQDANSMFLRLLSETGAFGVLLFVFFLIKNNVSRKANEDSIYWLVSGALLLCILLNLIRQGNYFLCGFPFFMWFYYFNRLAYQQKSFVNQTVKY